MHRDTKHTERVQVHKQIQTSRGYSPIEYPRRQITVERRIHADTNRAEIG